MTVEIVDTKELHRLAQAATPGPWEFEDVGYKYVVSKSGDGYISREVCKLDGSTMSAFRQKENGPFIAAANPTTIEVLLDRIQLLEQEKVTLMGILRRAGNTIEALDGTSVENERLVDDYHSALSICSGEGGIPVGAISTLLSQAMEVAVENGANSVSMPDEYVEIAAWLCGVPAVSGTRVVS